MIRLRPTMLSDLDFVVSVEQDARNLVFITPWERTQHEGAIRFPDSRHFIVEAGDQWEPVGRAHGEFFKAIRPATSMVEVSRLIAPEILVEIEADAVVSS